jgi:hypothetical protein
MISYLKSVEKHTFDIPNIAFKLYSNIVVHGWVDLEPCQPKRGVVEADFSISKKVSTISVLSPSSFCWNACNNIPYIAWVSCNKSYILTSISLLSSLTCEELVLI